jgi:hypothetical protein
VAENQIAMIRMAQYNLPISQGFQGTLFCGVTGGGAVKSAANNLQEYFLCSAQKST